MQYKQPLVVSLLLISALLWPAGSSATDVEPSHYDRINLSVQAIDEIDNDTLVAILYAQREGSELAALSEQVNRVIAEAVRKSKQSGEVKVQTLSYQTHPNYQKQRLIGWRVRQAIQLKSRNIGVLSGLIGELQENLAVESIGYSISMQQRNSVEERLIGEAIQAFSQRAKNITRHLNRREYRLVNMEVNTAPATVGPMRYRVDRAMLESRVAPPTVEPGTQSVTVTINGTIELTVK